MTDELSIKIRDAIQWIKEHEPQEGYYLAFSGGKDSIVIYDLAVKAGVKFEARFHMTTVDPNEIRYFIRDNYPDVIWDRPKTSMFKLIEKHGMPPTRTMRWCCRELKEIGGRGRLVMTGIRHAESNNRAKRKLFEESRAEKGKFFLHPIIYWSDSDVWDYIKRNNMKYCCLYDQGKSRIGCIMCPMQNTKGMLKDKEMFPKYYNAYLRAFGRMLKSLKAKGKEWRHGTTPEEVMYWWIHNADVNHTSTQEQLQQEPRP
jgi:phosphoadenosine phosphosulfate reductase